MKKILFACLALVFVTAVAFAAGETLRFYSAWAGAGGLDKVVTNKDSQIPISKDNLAGVDASKAAFVVFYESAVGAQDSLEFKFTHKNDKDATGAWSWAGIGIPAKYWTSFKVSKNWALRLYIKGLVKGNEVAITLADGSKPDEVHTDPVNIEKYVAPGTETDWRQVTIPLADFPNLAKVKLDDMKTVKIQAMAEGSYDLLIDQVTFEKSFTKPKAAAKAAVKAAPKATATTPKEK